MTSMYTRADSKVEVNGFEARHYDLFMNLITGGTYPFFIRRVVKDMQIQPADGILDLGCGTGRNISLMNRYLSEEGRVLGLDISLGLPVYANADLLRSWYSLSAGEYKSIGLPTPPEELPQQANLRLSDSPIEVLSSLWTTGKIRERLEPEGRSPNHFIHADGEWHPDQYHDDMSLVMDTQDGLVIICGCCHSGLLNTLAHVKRTFQRPIIAILGGTHLATANETYLEHVSYVFYVFSLNP